jgi:hypothetical protein
MPDVDEPAPDIDDPVLPGLDVALEPGIGGNAAFGS